MVGDVCAQPCVCVVCLVLAAPTCLMSATAPALPVVLARITNCSSAALPPSELMAAGCLAAGLGWLALWLCGGGSVCRGSMVKGEGLR